MSTFPGSPRLIKGTLVSFDIANPLALSVIVFQFNPATLTRTLQPQTAGEEGAIFETQRLKGAPIETIRLEAEIDAADQLEQGQPLPTEPVGIHPQLAALEMLVYPKSPHVITNTVLLEEGLIEITPPMGPIIYFIWGWHRILPVRLTELTITEEAFDANLDPIRARVSLSLRVLSYNDMTWRNPGYEIFMAHQLIKEGHATIGSINMIGSGIGAFSPRRRERSGR